MRLLLDTHALAWWLDDSPKLGPAARAAMMDAANSVLVSAVAAMEVTTKVRIGRWPEAAYLAAHFQQIIADEGFLEMPLTVAQAALAGTLPIDHADPFDRLLIAQAQAEDIPLLSNEVLFDGFGVKRLW